MSPSTSSKTNDLFQGALIFYQYIWNGSFKKNKLVYNLIDQYINFNCQFPSTHCGVISSKSFVQIFEEKKESFEKNPPKAHFIDGSGSKNQSNYKLSNPIYKFDHLTYDAELIDGSTHDILGSGVLYFDLFPNQNPFPDTYLSSQLLEHKVPPQRAVIYQQITSLIAQGAMEEALKLLYSIDTSSIAEATEKIFKDENQEVK